MGVAEPAMAAFAFRANQGIELASSKVLGGYWGQHVQIHNGAAAAAGHPLLDDMLTRVPLLPWRMQHCPVPQPC